MACGGGQTVAAPAGHAAHSGHGGHGAHSHDSPEDLRPLMHDLRRWLGEVQGALNAGEIAQAASGAESIANACDDVAVHEFDPELFGPRFAEIDRELHGAASAMADALRAGDGLIGRQRYRQVIEACVSCHAQAPTGSEVNLGTLLDANPPLPDDEVSTTYDLNGEDVPRTAFQSMRAQLYIAEGTYMHGELENEDGSHGGTEATYAATHRESGSTYDYTEIDFVDAEGRRSRRLQIRAR